MAIRITDECINCGACEPECPNNAIYEGAVDWKASDGTALKGKVVMKSGLTIDADAPQEPVSDDIYFIVTENVQNVKVSMRNRNVQRFVRLTAVFPTRIM